MSIQPRSVPLKRPPGVLGEIVARKLREVEAGALDEAVQGAAPLGARLGFVEALAGGRHGAPRLIAEVKPRSPSRGQLRADPTQGQLVEQARIYQRCGAAAVSVLCDGPAFGGSFALMRAVATAIDRPVLCKEFIVSHGQLAVAAHHGAGAVLLMASVLPRRSLRELLDGAERHGLSALVEVHDEAELEDALAVGAAVIGVNARDLVTLQIDLRRGAELLTKVPEDRVRVAESGIATALDVAAISGLADAALVGSTLMVAEDVPATIAALGFARNAG